MDGIENLEAPKELNDIDTEVPHIASPLKVESILDEIMEEKNWQSIIALLHILSR